MYPDPKLLHEMFLKPQEARRARVEQDHLADKAAATRDRHPVAAAIGRTLGVALVTAGEQLKGVSHRDPNEQPVTLHPGDVN